MSNSSPEKMIAALDAALPHQTTINTALSIEKWDAKTKKDVTKAIDALKGMVRKLTQFKDDAPDAIASIKVVIDKASDKLAGRPVEFEEYMEPETEHRQAA